MATPTARSLAFLRRQGYCVAIVEKWIPKINRRADLWKFGDLLAVHAARKEFLIVQTTSLGNIASRVKKARQQPELEQWLLAGGRFEVHGWHGSSVKRVEVLVGDLEPVVLARPPRRTRGVAAWQPAALFGG